MLIIFDLDGTLVDSARDLTESLNYAVLGYRSGAPFTVAQVKQLVGEGVTRLIEKALKTEDADTVSKVRARFLEHYHMHITDYTRPYPGMREALESLAACRKAVVSNKNELLSVKVLRDLDLYGYFDVVLGSDSVQEIKPSPIPLVTAMTRLGVPPEQCVMVGDSDLDIQAGHRAGVFTCAVTWGFRSRELLERFSPDLTIEHPVDLVSYFGGRC